MHPVTVRPPQETAFAAGGDFGRSLPEHGPDFLSGESVVALANTIHEQHKGVPTLSEYRDAQFLMSQAVLQPQYSFDSKTKEYKLDHYVAPDGSEVPVSTFNYLRAIADPSRWVQDAATEKLFKRIGEALRVTSSKDARNTRRTKVMSDAAIEDALPEVVASVEHLGLNPDSLDADTLERLAALSSVAGGELVMQGINVKGVVRERHRSIGRAVVPQVSEVVDCHPHHTLQLGWGAGEWLQHRHEVRRATPTQNGPPRRGSYINPPRQGENVVAWLLGQGARGKHVRPMLTSLEGGGSKVYETGARGLVPGRNRRHIVSPRRERQIEWATKIMSVIDRIELNAKRGRRFTIEEVVTELFPRKEAAKLTDEDLAILGLTMDRLEAAAEGYWRSRRGIWRARTARWTEFTRQQFDKLAQKFPRSERGAKPTGQVATVSEVAPAQVSASGRPAAVQP